MTLERITDNRNAVVRLDVIGPSNTEATCLCFEETEIEPQKQKGQTCSSRSNSLSCWATGSADLYVVARVVGCSVCYGLLYRKHQVFLLLHLLEEPIKLKENSSCHGWTYWPSCSATGLRFYKCEYFLFVGLSSSVVQGSHLCKTDKTKHFLTYC